MLVRGRRVYPRHLFPELVAPWIHLGRLRLRCVWFFTTPIHIVSLWMTSVVAGILGVMLTILLFRQPAPAQGATASLTGPGPAIATEPFSAMEPLASFSFQEPVMAANASTNLTVHLFPTSLGPRWNLGEQMTQRSAPAAAAAIFGAMADSADGWRSNVGFRTTGESSFRRPYINSAVAWSSAAHSPALVSSERPAIFGGTSSRTPGLFVTREAPAAGANGETLTYSLVLQNVSAEALENVVVTETVSDLQCVESAVPAAEVSSNALHWVLGRIAPGGEARLQVTIRPLAGAGFEAVTNVNATVAVSSVIVVAEPTPAPSVPTAPLIHDEPRAFLPTPHPAEIEPASSEFRPPIKALEGTPQLSVDASFPSWIHSGEELSSIFVIRNTGTAEARDVVLRVQVPSQLEHRFGQVVEHRLDRIAAGGTRRAIFRSVARTEGIAGLNAQLLHEDQDAATWSTSVQVLPKATSATSQKPVTLLVDR